MSRLQDHILHAPFGLQSERKLSAQVAMADRGIREDSAKDSQIFTQAEIDAWFDRYSGCGAWFFSDINIWLRRDPVVDCASVA